MKIIDTEQNTAEWLEERRKRITGTRASALAMKHYQQIDIDKLSNAASRALGKAQDTKSEEKAKELREKAKEYTDKADEALIQNRRYKVPQDFWQLLAENIADAPDGENAADRGHRLENENARIALEKIGISEDDTNYDPGMWASDKDGRIAVSPDVSELSLEPTWAVECKSLGTANHLSYVLPIIAHRKIVSNNVNDKMMGFVYNVLPEMTWDESERDFDFVPEKYKPQVLQYFAVNEKLETLYFSFYDPRCHDDNLAHCYLTIPRGSVEKEFCEQLRQELNTLAIIDGLKGLAQ